MTEVTEVIDVTDFLAECRSVVGAAHVITDAPAMATYLTDWRQRFTACARAVIAPATPEEVAAIVRLCKQFLVPIVPQGGNTGLVLGGVPDHSGQAIVLSLRRLNRIRAIDAQNNTMTVEAGCILADIQQAASAEGRLFPLSLAAEGSCSIGGNLSTNAGGTAVLQYGNMRALCLGLEVVTADGDIWDGLRGLRKDNTGYDLRDLFIGAEGTLGVITACVLKLHSQPKAQCTALAALQSPRHALQLLTAAQNHCGATLTGFELMSDYCVRLTAKHFPHMRPPFPPGSPNYRQYVLLELSDHESEQHAVSLLETLMERAIEDGIIDDAIVAASLAQSRALWQMREHIPLAQAVEGKNIKHDISLPISSIADFIAATDDLLQAAFPGCCMVCFGHLGDGNLHYNVAAPDGVDADSFIHQQDAVNRIVYDSVQRFGGSISAEHGIGALKREELRRSKSALEIKMMAAIKAALDPLNLMNPGKVI